MLGHRAWDWRILWTQSDVPAAAGIRYASEALSILKTATACDHLCCNNFGRLPKLAAMCRVSSRVNNFAAELRPGLVIDIGELLFVSVSHDVVVGLDFGRPGCREATSVLGLDQTPDPGIKHLMKPPGPLHAPISGAQSQTIALPNLLGPESTASSGTTIHSPWTKTRYLLAVISHSPSSSG